MDSESSNHHFDYDCRIESNYSTKVDDVIEERPNIGTHIVVMNIVTSISIPSPSKISCNLRNN